MKLIIFLLFLISPLIISAMVIVSPLYFGYKIISRLLDYREAKNGYNKAPQNSLMSFAMPFVKDMFNAKK